MKKTLMFLVALSFILICVNSSLACVPFGLDDSAYMIRVGGNPYALDFDINFEQLKAACRSNESSCTTGLGYTDITIRSTYDNDVAVKISKEQSIQSIEIRLPYDVKWEDEFMGEVVQTTHDPDDFKWAEAVEKDLKFLRLLNVIDLDDASIDRIKNLAAKGADIQLCSYGWQDLREKDHCDDILYPPDEEGAVVMGFRGCGSGSSGRAVLPKNVLKIK